MFITRPTRDALTSHYKLIEAMQELEGTSWTGNREAHRELERLLTAKKVKASGVSNDGSGGRTWAALARTFGYWYPNSNNQVTITPVALAILAGEFVHQHVQKQILNYQIPNGYVLTSGFSPKYEPGYRIFPFRFMLKLLTIDELEHKLHRDEISLFFLPTKTDLELPKVVETIMYYRNLKEEDGLDLCERSGLLNGYATSHDHRRRSDSDGVNFLDYLSDSSLTHMIIMESVNYYWFSRSDGLIELKKEMVKNAQQLINDFDSRYHFNARFKISEESFARHYGLDLFRSKNTFRHGQGVVTRAQKRDALLKQTAEKILHISPFIDNNTLIKEVKYELPLEEAIIATTLRRLGLLQDEEIDQLGADFIDSYLENATNSKFWLDFENQTLNLAETFLDQAFRPQKREDEIDRANIEIAVKLSTFNNFFGGIIDCKSGQKFHLGTRERDLMATSYIPMYRNLVCPDGSQVPLRFFGFIVGENFSGNKNFNMIAEKAKQFIKTDEYLDGFVINARSFLTLADLFHEELISSEDLFRVFTSNKVFLDPVHVRRFLNRP